jgi:DNA-binding response OmpR family regulator
MLMLGFISQDKALLDAVLEQMTQLAEWQVACFDSPTAAMDVWQEQPPPLILWDSKHSSAQDSLRFYELLQKAKTKPWLLTIGLALLPKEIVENIDTLARPLRLGKLLARLQFYKQRLQQPADKTYALGPFMFQPRRREIVKNKDVVKLTDKETALLEYLICAGGPVARDKLLEDIWGYGETVDTHTLSTHVYRLRQKLVTKDDEDCFVSTQGSYAINKNWVTL